MLNVKAYYASNDIGGTLTVSAPFPWSLRSSLAVGLLIFHINCKKIETINIKINIRWKSKTDIIMWGQGV